MYGRVSNKKMKKEEKENTTSAAATTAAIATSQQRSQIPMLVSRIIPTSSISMDQGWRSDLGNVDGLGENIKINGLLNQILVKRKGSKKFKIQAGRRRLAAIINLGAKFIEARMRISDLAIADSPCEICGYTITEEFDGKQFCSNHRFLLEIFLFEPTLFERISQYDKKAAAYVLKNAINLQKQIVVVEALSSSTTTSSKKKKSSTDKKKSKKQEEADTRN